MSTLKVLSLPTHANPRIVTMLEELLADAKAGKLTAIFAFYEDEGGNISHSRDGFSDNQAVFCIERTKQKILGGYL